MLGNTEEIYLAAQCIHVKTDPAAQLGMSLLAVVVGTVSREERTGLQSLPDGRLLGCNAGPAKDTVCPI